MQKRPTFVHEVPGQALEWLEMINVMALLEHILYNQEE